jgi:hypothetical protein
MIASGLTDKFWALATLHAADSLNIQYQADLDMPPHECLGQNQMSAYASHLE